MTTADIDRDLKAAMLARDSAKVEVLRGLKSAILYAEVELKLRETGLTEEQVLAVLKKEAKKREDAAGMYKQGGDDERARKELSELEVITAYLPAQLSDEAVEKLIDEALSELQITEPQRQDMGKIIGNVKAKAGAQVDPSKLAGLIQKRLS